jgi:hypothetical protein
MFYRLAGAIVTMTVVLTIASVGMGRPLAAAESPDLLAVPFGLMEGCLDCSNCGSDGHKAFTGDETSTHEYAAGPHSQCWETGDCALQHPPECRESFASISEALEGVRNAVSGDEVTAIERLLAENNLVRFEAARSAIQVLGCKGQIVGHFPVSQAMFASLNH